MRSQSPPREAHVSAAVLFAAVLLFCFCVCTRVALPRYRVLHPLRSSSHLTDAIALVQGLQGTQDSFFISQTTRARFLAGPLPPAWARAREKALVAGKTPKTLLARLCEGVRGQLEEAVSAMRKGGSSSAYHKLDSPFLVHVSFQQ